jgi:general secretion pathway protein H
MTSRSRLGRSGKRFGFTLIETLVVLAILGLALSIVAGFIPRGHDTLDLATNADGLANALRLARARAIARQQPVTFGAVAGGHAYVLDGAVRSLPSSMIISLVGPQAIRFAPDGSSSGGTVLLAAGALTRTLHVDWLTGRVSVSDAQ